MNKRNEARLNMYDAVIAYCNNNPLIIATVPAFEDDLAAFSSSVDNIHSVAQLEANVITGIAADKAQLRETLSALVVNVGGAIFSLASSTSNNELKQQASFTASDLARMKDGIFSLTCSNIRDLAVENLAALAPYGITSANTDSITVAIKNYNGKISSPRNAVSQRSAYRTSLQNLFKEADGILKNQLDKTAPLFKPDYPDFYTAYQNNRSIIGPGSSPTQIAGVVTNAANNQPVAGAMVQVVGQGISNITDADGNYILKSVNTGTQSITITKPNFSEGVLDNIMVKLGKTTKINASISPVAA